MNTVHIFCDFIVLLAMIIILIGEIFFLRERKVLKRRNKIMRQALEEIADETVLVGYNPPQGTEIDEYVQAITESIRDVRRLQSKAHMALEAISEEVE